MSSSNETTNSSNVDLSSIHVSKKAKTTTSNAEPINISVRKISGVPSNIAIPVRKVIVPKFPPNLFKLNTLAAFFGPRGSGKTNGAVLLAKEYIDYGSFTRVFILSPTYASNPVFEVLNIAPEDVYTDIANVLQSIDAVVAKIEADALRYQSELDYAHMYVKWMQEPDKILPAELIRLEREAFREPIPMKRPYPLILIDDCSHSQIYSTSRTNSFINLCLRHRHIGGEGYGCSIFMLVQNFKSGVPKVIRQNLQQFFIWRTADKGQLEAMWEEFANAVDFDTFEKIFHMAVDDDPHDFLTVDINPARDELGNFRKNFDTTLTLGDNSNIFRRKKNTKK